ncbi:hypothetical protein B7Z00_04840 [Candidatus Saccharibacteria bacterium 32-50-10]|nr:MAG: hypothetical protein B7Z00_04840 [Candidatus Saccharibacteria bacterium 32-50-10]
MCGREYNRPPADADEDWVAANEDFVNCADFGPLEIGPCCFRAFEKAISLWLPAAVTWRVAKTEYREKRAIADRQSTSDIAQLLNPMQNT